MNKYTFLIFTIMENKQKRIDIRMLRIARICSEGSYAIRRQVGCVIVKNNRIISDGYNGTPSGFQNICENYYEGDTIIVPKTYQELEEAYKSGHTLVTKPYVLHAEANAITKITKCGDSTEGATIYITDEPCIECAKLIIQSGIKRVVYWRNYTKHIGMDLLGKAGIECIQYTKIDN